MCVEGSVEAEVVWGSSDIRYVLQEDVVVQPGSTLTIDGATVVSEPGRRLVVNGTLHADGAIFTSSAVPPGPGDWCGISFEPGSSGLFGEEAPGEWLSEREALRRYRKIFRRYRLFGNAGIFARFPARLVNVGWYDTHATT